MVSIQHHTASSTPFAVLAILIATDPAVVLDLLYSLHSLYLLHSLHSLHLLHLPYSLHLRQILYRVPRFDSPAVVCCRSCRARAGCVLAQSALTHVLTAQHTPHTYTCTMAVQCSSHPSACSSYPAACTRPPTCAIMCRPWDVDPDCSSHSWPRPALAGGARARPSA